jgi:transcription initiation factor IIE alpha subunit
MGGTDVEDLALYKRALEVLKMLDGTPMLERVLGSDIEIACGRRLDAQEVRKALLWLRDNALASEKADRLNRGSVWVVTDKGRTTDI